MMNFCVFLSLIKKQNRSRMKYILVCLLLLGIGFSACRKDQGKQPETFTDAYLYGLAKDTTGKFTYKDAATASEFISDAAHGTKSYTLYMNKKANDACTASGKLPVGGSFPDSSLLVKYLKVAPGGALESYAVLYKLKGSWNWAKYDALGNATHSLKASSATCTGCHTSTRDLTWTFIAHP